jgi:hypothetical protein
MATKPCPVGKFPAEVDVGEELTGRQARIKARRERIKAREDKAKKKKRNERKARREAREKRIAERAKRYGPIPEEAVLPENNDPLIVTDRDGNEIGHCLRDLWAPGAGFLVCGGPSLKTLDLSPLRERGINSLGVNNVAGYAPVSAFTFSDPPEKFHHGVFFDAKVMKIVPVPKLKKRVRAKCEDGIFRMTAFRVGQCPNVWGYHRNAIWQPDQFLTIDRATWGHGKEGLVVDAKRPRILFTFFLGLRLLHYLGCRRVYMLGVDFRMSEQSGYAFDQNRWPGACRGNNNSYSLANRMLLELKPHFDEMNYEVFNCNPKSRCTVFPYVSYEKALEDVRGPVPKEPFDMSGWYEKTMNGQPFNENDDDREDDG